MEHTLFKPQDLEAGRHAVVGNCNGIPMDVRYREETPMFAKKILNIATGRRILDYGCGVGRLSKEILNQSSAATVVGVDDSQRMRDLAFKNIDSSSFRPMAPQELAESGIFDIAILVYVLQHIPAIEIREALQRIHYSLQDNGVLFYCSSDYRMAIRHDQPGFFDDRFLGVDLRKEVSRYFELVGPAFTDDELNQNEVVKAMVTGGNGGLEHPALIYRKKKLLGPSFNAEVAEVKGQLDTFVKKTFFEESEKPTGRAEQNVPQKLTSHIFPVNVPQRLVLIQKLSPGDILMTTVALRDLHSAYPGEYITDMRTPCNDLFKNNPRVSHIDPAPGEEEIIERLKANPKHPIVTANGVHYSNLHYPMIHESGARGTHFADAMTEFLSSQLNRPIKRTGLRPELYLDFNEQAWPSPVIVKAGYEGKYWVINAGSKNDYPLKQYPYYPETVRLLKDKISFVQIGHSGHNHPHIPEAINMIGMTDIRELIRVIYHAEGIVTCVALPMHIAAALKKPCVVVAGGREGTRWELYPDHQFLYTNGLLDCCQYDGCWKSKPKECLHWENGVAKCMKLIRPEDVARAVMLYYEGGVLS